MVDGGGQTSAEIRETLDDGGQTLAEILATATLDDQGRPMEDYETVSEWVPGAMSVADFDDWTITRGITAAMVRLGCRPPPGLEAPAATVAGGFDAAGDGSTRGLVPLLPLGWRVRPPPGLEAHAAGGGFDAAGDCSTRAAAMVELGCRPPGLEAPAAGGGSDAAGDGSTRAMPPAAPPPPGLTTPPWHLASPASCPPADTSLSLTTPPLLSHPPMAGPPVAIPAWSSDPRGGGSQPWAPIPAAAHEEPATTYGVYVQGGWCNAAGEFVPYGGGRLRGGKRGGKR